MIRRRKKNANRKPVCFAVIIALVGLVSCNDYTPKPRGYFLIDLPQPAYSPLTGFRQFTFDVSDQQQVEVKKDSAAAGEWLDLVYPQLNARIYCSYIPVSRDNFAFIEQESRHFVLLHTQKAHSFKEYTYENPEEQVYGSIYELDGDAISPIQFVLTDSTRSLFRGALYFDNTVQRDSIAPVIHYINQDIQTIIESFRWKR